MIVLNELVGFVLYVILYIIIVVGTFTTAKWLHELWRTRKDKTPPWFWWRQQ